MMNRDDMNELGLSPRQVVDVVSHFAGQTRVAPGFVVVEYPIPRRCAAMYYPESNVLAPIGSTEPLSNIPTYRAADVPAQNPLSSWSRPEPQPEQERRPHGTESAAHHPVRCRGERRDVVRDGHH